MFMEKVEIRPIESYLLSNLINTISVVSSDCPCVDAIYITTPSSLGISKNILDVHILCNDIDEGADIKSYFEEIADLVKRKTSFDINLIIEDIRNVRGNILNGAITFDRYGNFVNTNNTSETENVELSPALDLRVFKSWEQNKPSYEIKLKNQEYNKIKNFLETSISRVRLLPGIRGMYLVSFYSSGSFRLVVEVVATDERKAKELSEDLNIGEYSISVGNSPVRVSFEYSSIKDYNIANLENARVIKNLRYLANGDIVIDKDEILEEVQDLCRSQAYRTVFKPDTNRVGFEPPIKLERI